MASLQDALETGRNADVALTCIADLTMCAAICANVTSEATALELFVADYVHELLVRRHRR